MIFLKNMFEGMAILISIFFAILLVSILPAYLAAHHGPFWSAFSIAVEFGVLHAMVKSL